MVAFFLLYSESTLSGIDANLLVDVVLVLSKATTERPYVYCPPMLFWLPITEVAVVVVFPVPVPSIDEVKLL